MFNFCFFFFKCIFRLGLSHHRMHNTYTHTHNPILSLPIDLWTNYLIYRVFVFLSKLH